MAILTSGVVIETVGQVGNFPRFITIPTNNTKEQVEEEGYLNQLVSQGFPLSEQLMAIVSTSDSPKVELYNILKSGSNFSLIPISTNTPPPPPLPYTLVAGVTNTLDAASPVDTWTVPGCTPQSTCMASLKTFSNREAVVGVECLTNQISVTFMAAPGNGTSLHYLLFTPTV